MNIGDVSRASSLPPETIRYYEEIGLLRPARGANGYRTFVESDVHKLVFLARSRSLGFSIEECRTLLSLYEDRGRESADVKRLASDHVAEIDRKVAELVSMKATLESLMARCSGDDRLECPILEDLAAPVSRPG